MDRDALVAIRPTERFDEWKARLKQGVADRPIPDLRAGSRVKDVILRLGNGTVLDPKPNRNGEITVRLDADNEVYRYDPRYLEML